MDPGRRGSKAAQIIWVAGGDDGASLQIGVSHQEGIDRHLGSGADRTEELAGPDADAAVDGMDLDPLPSQAGEYASVGWAAADHLGQHGSDRGDRQIPRSHLGHQGSDPVSSKVGTMGHGRDSFAVQDQHSAGLGWAVAGNPIVHDPGCPLQRLGGDRAVVGVELGQPLIDRSKVP